ncbi:MAG: hypothetical protein Q8K32_23120 [Archangium sp.]|nr:hypothetical protein [Archangium sp.]
MKCTSCKKNVADDAAVCPFCDTVLDPSLLDASPPEDDDEPAPPPRRPAPRPGVKPATKPGVKKVAAKPAVKKRATNVPRTEEEDDALIAAEKKERAANDWRSQVSEEDWKANQGKAPEKFVATKAMDPELAMGATKQYLWELSMADKLALAGTSVLLISTFFPWKETVAEGDVLGVFSSGILVTLLASMAVAGIIIRTRKTMPTLNPLLPWVAQLGCVGVSALWCLVYMKLSWDSTPAMSSVGNYEVWVSKPAFGLILGVLAAIVSIVGTIFGLKDVGR